MTARKTTTPAVLDLTSGVSAGTFRTALTALLDALETWRAAQPHCTAFWDYVTQLSPRFARVQAGSYGTANIKVTAPDGDLPEGITREMLTDDGYATYIAGQEAGYAAELRDIRGRVLSFVSTSGRSRSITLAQANVFLAAAGLPTYEPPKLEGTPYGVIFGAAISLHSTEENFDAWMQEKVREFCTALGAENTERVLSTMYAERRADTPGVPASELVKLLDQH